MVSSGFTIWSIRLSRLAFWVTRKTNPQRAPVRFHCETFSGLSLQARQLEREVITGGLK